MTALYGLPAGTSIQYGGKGFPQWVYDLADVFGVQASTYPNHQEGNRAEAGFAPNPHGLNRGIDWAGPVANMQRLADYLLSIRGSLEQVIWQNPNTGQRVGVAGGEDVTHTAYYAQDYSGHTDHVHTRQARPIPLPSGVVITTTPPRPKFTEIEAWSQNHSPRNGVRIDLFLLHTQEGGDGDARALAQWMNGHDVSYHYTVSTGRKDVTVCDVVDTDLASWSVLSANPRSINLCFAGSRASWKRVEWLANRNSIEAAAYLAVQDCRKYNIPIKVIAPPYGSARAGISDHNYVTQVLGDGSHTDVGPNFPWDVFAEAVAKFSGVSTPTTQPEPEGGFLMSLSDAEQREVLDLLRQQAAYRRISRSPLRHVGEGETETIAGFQWNTDGNVHVLLVRMLAQLGDPDALALLREVAALDPNRYPERAHDRLLAQAILNDVTGATIVGTAPPTGMLPGVVIAPPVQEAPPAPVAPPPPLPRIVDVEPSQSPSGSGMASQLASLQAEIETLRASLSELTSQIRS